MSSYPTRRHQRLREYAYTSQGSYFVTICTENRLPLLGRIEGGEMRLSPAGDMVRRLCEEMISRHAEVDLDTLVVMPDHLHMVVSLLSGGPSLSALIQGLKSRTTVEYGRGVVALGWPAFKGRLWQKGFYDRVIRDDAELEAVRRYVLQNAMRLSARGQP
jgi:putative transposase